MADSTAGAQRISIERLREWEGLKYGMFIHFGMSTYDGAELSSGGTPVSAFAPDRLNVGQWLSVARDAGMKYAVLTAKHVSGFCLWPSKHTDYHVGNSPVRVDVLEQFVKACEEHSIRPGFYYCSWDNHHRFGSVTPSDTYLGYPGSAGRAGSFAGYTTQRYRDFQMAQVEELCTQYGKLLEVWIDIPGVLGTEGRIAQYEQIARLQPEGLVMMNQGIGDGSQVLMEYAWPTDLMAIERYLPNSRAGYEPWHELAPAGGTPKKYYIPAEVCDPIGHHWFAQEKDPPRSDGELLGMRLVANSRRANLLLNVPPSRHGLIEDEYVAALNRLQKNVEKLGVL